MTTILNFLGRFSRLILVAKSDPVHRFVRSRSTVLVVRLLSTFQIGKQPINSLQIGSCVDWRSRLSHNSVGCVCVFFLNILHFYLKRIQQQQKRNKNNRYIGEQLADAPLAGARIRTAVRTGACTVSHMKLHDDFCMEKFVSKSGVHANDPRCVDCWLTVSSIWARRVNSQRIHGGFTEV